MLDETLIEWYLAELEVSVVSHALIIRHHRSLSATLAGDQRRNGREVALIEVVNRRRWAPLLVRTNRVEGGRAVRAVEHHDRAQRGYVVVEPLGHDCLVVFRYHQADD